MIACLAEADSDALALDRNELEDAFWADRAGIISALAGEADAPFLAPPPFAIAHTLFVRWIERGE
jgi:NAD+ diphosphatase